jgi:hypothetical protein
MSEGGTVPLNELQDRVVQEYHRRLDGFVADMRSQDIHVGMGKFNPTCVTCGEPWPCDASTA